MTDFSYPVGMLMFVELYRTLGPERFDRAYREFFQQYRGRGATTAQLIATFGQSSPDAERVFAEWMRSAQWSARLSRQP
jgi:aminopeptidase N